MTKLSRRVFLGTAPAAAAAAGVFGTFFSTAAEAAIKWDETYNVIVIGAGGAGLSAAVAAAESGKKVILLEKNGFAGGNTSVSGGCFNVANRNQDHLTMSEGQKKIVEGIINQKPLNPLHAELINKVKDQWTKYKESGSNKLFDSPELHALSLIHI